MDAYYASRYTPDPTRTVVWKEIVRFLTQYVPEKGTVLDLGAGYCDFINNVSAEKKYAVDRSEELRSYAGKDVQSIQSTAWAYPTVPDASVDVVHASNLLEHLNEAELALTMAEAKRVLRSGGKLILLQPNWRFTYRSYFDDPTHVKIFSDVSLESFLVSHGFRIVLTRPKFLPFSLRSRPSFIPASPWLVRAYIASPWKPMAGQMLFIAEKP